MVVGYATDAKVQSGCKFLDQVLQTAVGVPLQCDEGAGFMTFRVGLFGLQKWRQVDRTVGGRRRRWSGLGWWCRWPRQLLAEGWVFA